jgi:divalent metal cation (Fe/Co/Zn/Cd) transporter
VWTNEATCRVSIAVVIAPRQWRGKFRGTELDPQAPERLLALALAGVVGFLGNEAAAVVRVRVGRRLDSSALVADDYHACTDGIVSLGVMANAAFVARGAQLPTPLSDSP